LTITVTVAADTAGQTITNTAVIDALDQPDPDLSNNSDQAAITVQPAPQHEIYLPLVLKN